MLRTFTETTITAEKIIVEKGEIKTESLPPVLTNSSVRSKSSAINCVLKSLGLAMSTDIIIKSIESIEKKYEMSDDVFLEHATLISQTEKRRDE